MSSDVSGCADTKGMRKNIFYD